MVQDEDTCDLGELFRYSRILLVLEELWLVFVLSQKRSKSMSLFFLRPPATRVSDKVMIPQDEYPEINFVGLLIGPR